MTVAIANQWAGTFAQLSGFGNSYPALQSTVIALDSGTSVGGGSGTPTAGNWLVCISGWNQSGTISSATVAAQDDIHSFWRPGNETTSTWTTSPAAGNTGVSIWYTPNLATVPGNQYIAPSGVVAGMACLVVELSGPGPWDVVTGIATNFGNAVTSLNLALPAPSAASFAIAAVCGDSSAVSQAFAPSGWTALHTVTATDGSDHLCDAVLTSAFLPSFTGSLSVTGTASSTDLSGSIIAFEISAPSPIPAGHNPNWPYLKFEAAFGGGFQTPPDQLTWTDLSSRLWSWDETTGVQYQLGEIQATNLELELDNYDNALASDYPGSPYYSNAINANMSFQSGIQDWTATGSSALAWSNAQAYSSSPGAVATYSLQVTPNGSTASPGAISEKDAVSASTAYSASAWFYSVAGYSTGAQVAITWYTSGGTLISTVTSGAVLIPAAAWTQVELLNQASPSNAAFAAITEQFSGTPSATAYWVAEAALNPGASAVATGLIGTGVPLRIRAAIGTLGGVTSNRWYVIQRNAEMWPQQVDSAFRRYVAASATDIWSTMSNTEPTPYRGEVYQDAPYAWWAMDDQPLDSGVQPVTLRNAAPGNTNVLNINGASGGVTPGDQYSTTGTDLTTDGTVLSGIPPGNPPPSVAVYAVDQEQGWMYGDPLASSTAYATSNPVTASPGSAAWQQTGLLGDTGSNGWFMSCNDTSFPPLSAGITFSLWFNAGFFGSAAGFTDTSSNKFDVAGQPYSQITLAELATSSNPVAILYLDISGHLILETFNGASGTTHSIYSTSDLRSGSFHRVTLTATTTTWAVYVDGGQTASATGTATGMTSAWTWLIVGADLGSSGGSSLSSAVHMGNVAFSHVQVFPKILPPWRETAHYCAAATGFGLVPAPKSLALSTVSNRFAGVSYTPDGSEFQGSYGSSGSTVTSFGFSAVVTANIGSYSSGPSARSATAGIGTDPSVIVGRAVWAGWTGLASLFTVYTAQDADAETSAGTAAGSGMAFTANYGSSATSGGACKVSGGAGASPPASASALGDTVQNRIERLLGDGKVTYPGRCIDPAPLQVQAATDVGGQQASINITNIVSSDGGLMFVDNLGYLTYWQRPHLAAQFANPLWSIGPNSGEDPYYREIKWLADPQRVWNAITIAPFSPDEGTPPLLGPTQAAAVTASQAQYGAQPLSVTSYLQSGTEQQNQANSLFSNFGTLHIRAENVKLDAAPDPSLWSLILGINVADLATAQMWQIGSGGTQWTFRVSEIKRRLEFDGERGETTAQVVLKLDFEPTYWS